MLWVCYEIGETIAEGKGKRDRPGPQEPPVLPQPVRDGLYCVLVLGVNALDIYLGSRRGQDRAQPAKRRRGLSENNIEGICGRLEGRRRDEFA